MDLTKVTIETERLRLVPRSIKYAEQILLEYRDPVIQYMNHGPPESLEILLERIKKTKTEMKEGKLLLMVILLKETGEFVGCMALEDLEEENPEMGGWLKKSAHGHGYGREAAAALNQWAKDNLEYDHILWPCAVANISSCKLAESLGGKVHREYEKKQAKGTILPFVDYWISRNDKK